MYVDDALDWIKDFFLIFGLLLCIAIIVVLTMKKINIAKLQNETNSIKNKLEIENLKLDNELKKIQLKELGFDFTEESKQIEEK